MLSLSNLIDVCLSKEVQMRISCWQVVPMWRSWMLLLGQGTLEVVLLCMAFDTPAPEVAGLLELLRSTLMSCASDSDPRTRCYA